jgi:transposase
LILDGKQQGVERSNWAKMSYRMKAINSWAVSDQLWVKVEPLVPAVRRLAGRQYQRQPGAGRKPMPARRVFSAIVYVLRTGCQWKALPKKFGSASAVHKHFQDWQKVGFFLRLWRAGLAEYDGMEGIAWEWQSIDGATGKAPLARECVGPNPTDRGKKWAQAKFVSGRPGRPAVARR